MIRGLGIDLAEIARIRQSFERFGDRFARKVLTDKELAVMRTRRDPVPYLTALWAGKEAAVKALGTGFTGGVHLKTIEIIHLPSGKPEIAFLGAALEVARALGVSSAYVSLTHERGMAAAVVVVEGD
ncbi:MAG: holo-ACP synthase [Proteobacteria bacterium]|nr:holo-ACP synthase [Pseudomonadota bacterium]MBU1612571.1 holo-ACP synthase [Pseudomonadota bacterium]